MVTGKYGVLPVAMVQNKGDMVDTTYTVGRDLAVITIANIVMCLFFFGGIALMYWVVRKSIKAVTPDEELKIRDSISAKSDIPE